MIIPERKEVEGQKNDGTRSSRRVRAEAAERSGAKSKHSPKRMQVTRKQTVREGESVSRGFEQTTTTTTDAMTDAMGQTETTTGRRPLNVPSLRSLSAGARGRSSSSSVTPCLFISSVTALLFHLPGGHL